jgi:YVTN family beta-propeller protein
VPFSIQVQLVDGSGKPLKIPFGAFVTASLATGPTGAVLSGTLVVGTSSTGLASFTNLSVDKAGTYTLTFTNSVKNCLPGTTGSFDVDGVDHFSFSAIATPQTLGDTGTAVPAFTLTALDSGNNVLTGYLGTVTLTSTDATATFMGNVLPRTVTFLPADNGVHAFTASQINFNTHTSGPQTITATDTVVTSATGTSNQIFLLPGSFVFSAIATPEALGTSGTSVPSFTVTALDAGSSVLTGYVGTVTFTSTDATATLPGATTFLPADNGVHSFTAGAVVFNTKKSGPQTITATDNVVTAAKGTSNQVFLQPASLAGGSQPTTLQSAALGLTGDDQTLVNVNPTANSVTVFDVSTPATPVKLAEITVGADPRNVAVHPNGLKAYVTNSADGTVSVVDLIGLTVTTTIPVGVEPIGCCLTPNGTTLYVTNEISDSVSVIDTTSDTVTTTIDLSGMVAGPINGQSNIPIGTHPRAIAITNNGDTTDTDEFVFVAMFFGVQRVGTENVNLPTKSTFRDEGQDDERDGHIVKIPVGGGFANQIIGLTSLSPMATSVTAFAAAGCGFNSNGSVLPQTKTSDGVGTAAAAPHNPAAQSFPTGCFPNQLASIAIRPVTGSAYVVSTAASPNGPFRFDSNVQGLVSVFSPTTLAETIQGPAAAASSPLNLNVNVGADTNNPKVFYSNPVAMAWRPDGSDAWIVCQQGDVVVRMTAGTTGAPTSPTINAGAGLTITHIDLDVKAGGAALPNNMIPGMGPRGIVINRTGTNAFVSCFTSRSVSVLDITSPAPATPGTTKVIATTYSTTNGFNGGNPLNGPTQTLLGEQLFYSGRGPQGRLSKAAWGACIVCHPDGLSDNVTWIFPPGPVQTIPLDATFAPPHDATAIQRIMNWSAGRDEVQDFELNTRAVLGGRGLIDDDRCIYPMGGVAAGVDQSTIEQFQQFLATSAATPPIADGTNDDLAPTQPAPLSNANITNFGFPRRDFAATGLPDGKIIIIGGRTGGTVGTNGVTTAQATGGLITGTNMVVEFDPKTNTFTPMQTFGLPATGLICAGAATVKTKAGIRVYVIGGYFGSPGTAANLSNGNFVFDPSVAGTPPGSNWLQDVAMPSPTAQFGICTTGGFSMAEPVQVIHCVLGTIGAEGTVVRPGFGDVQIFVPSDNPGDGTGGTSNGQWRPIQGNGRLKPRSMLGAAAVARGAVSHVIVIGGIDATGTPLKTVEDYIATPTLTPDLTQVNYSIAANPMTVIPGITLAANGPGAGLANFGIATAGTSIYLFGGNTKNNVAAIVESNQILELTTTSNPGVTASNQGTGAPQGVWKAVGTLTGSPRQGFAVATPPQIANLAGQPSGGRSANLDAIAAWVQQKVRSYKGIQTNTASIAAGRTLFSSLGCATCHGGPNWTRSTVDYPLDYPFRTDSTRFSGTAVALNPGLAPGPAPAQQSAISNLFNNSLYVSSTLQTPLGPEEIAPVGAGELVRTNTAQGETGSGLPPVPSTGVTTAFPSPATSVWVLNTVNTDQANGGSQARINEKRSDTADVSNIVDAFGAHGFNIPSLLSVGGTAPYFHDGLAPTLLNVIDGSVDNQVIAGTNVQVHLVPNTGTNQQDLINFLMSIDSTTTTFP